MLAVGLHGDLYELMVNTAAYGGLRWGEFVALTVDEIDTVARVIDVDRKVVEVAGRLFLEAPKNRKHRRTVYPRETPWGYPLAERLAERIEAARAEQEAGTNPLGLIFPSSDGKHWQSSNFSRRVLLGAANLESAWAAAVHSTATGVTRLPVAPGRFRGLTLSRKPLRSSLAHKRASSSRSMLCTSGSP